MTIEQTAETVAASPAAAPLALDKTGSWLIIAIGLAQSIAVLLLIKWLPTGWLGSPWLTLLTWTAVCYLPLSAQWLMPYRRRPFYWLMLGGIAALMVLTTWHTDSILVAGYSIVGPFVWFIASGVFAWYAIMTFGEFAATTTRRAQDYPRLFALAARNVLLPIGATLFTLLVAGLMMIWSGLFNLLGFKQIASWLLNSWVLYPLHGLAFGMATAVLIARPNLVDGARRVIAAIGSALSPLAALIVVAFIGGIAIAGLEPVWKTGYATHLILTLVVVFTLFLNAVHDDGRNLQCLPRPMLILVRFAAALLPVLIGLSIYSLGLRAAQYGWTPKRVFGAVTLGFGAVIAIGYFIAAIRPRATLPDLARPNMIALAVLALLGIVTNTPLLSPFTIAADNQTARVLDGRTSADRVEWGLFANGMGQPGRDALARIAAAETAPADIRARAEQALKAPANQFYALNRPNAPAPRPKATYRVWPKDEAPDAALQAAIEKVYTTHIASDCSGECPILALDLDGDGTDEMTLLTRNSTNVFKMVDGSWQRVGILNYVAPSQSSFDQMMADLRAGKARAVEPAYKNIEIGGVTRQIMITPRP